MTWSFSSIIPVNFGWLTLFVSSKVTREDSFNFKMLLTIFSLQEKSFQQIHCWLKKIVKSLTLSLRTGESVLPSQLTLITENLLANCHFSKKDILQMIRNPDSNKALGHDMVSIRVLKFCCDLVCQSQEIIFKTWY